ncbi:MAG: phage tail spike protein, partial [Clostridium perfringens]|nr:phage tail spike protein [Clostridium perfringens]
MQYYKSSNSNFNKNGDVKLKPINGTVRLELNTGLNEIDFEIPYDKTGKWKKISCWGVVKQKVFYSKNKQLYRIYNVTKGMFSIKIKARHIFFDLVKRNILDARAVNLNGERALNTILQGTRYTGHSDINIINTAYFVQTNIVAAINGDKDNTFRNRWGGEMLYDNFDIYINHRIGADYGVKVRYGVNMENVDLDINRDEIITRAYPIAFDGKMLPEKYIDSKLINKYPFICEGYVDMSDLKLKDSNSEDDEGFETEEELFNAMRERMLQIYDSGIDKPKVSGSVKMVNLENTIEYKDFKNLVNVGIGDTVTVRHKNIDVDMKTRAIAIEWDIISEKYTDVEFGDVELNYFDNQEMVNGRLENILNKNGTVNANEMEGVINALQTKFKALRDVAQPQHILGMLFEDRIKGSKTYGAMAIGSMGLMIASKRLPDDSDWDWNTFIGGGFAMADWLIGNLMTVLITNKDKSFEIDLKKPGGALFRNNGKDAIKIENNMIKLYNWKKNGDYIGALMS